jgi:hypothetical protein
MKKLPTSDYKLLEVDGQEYVFLTGSQELMEITNPLLTPISTQLVSQKQKALMRKCSKNLPPLSLPRETLCISGKTLTEIPDK